MWLEDELSMEAKLKLMKEYDLAGISAWRLGFEKSSVWELILKYVN
jgi:spore germination protein YaaH